MNYIDFMKNGGIHIKEENRGKFTASAKRAGRSVQEHADAVLKDPDATPLQKRRAQFAKNSKLFKHENGGVLFAQTGASVNLQYAENKKDSVTHEDPLKALDGQKKEESTTEDNATSTETASETNWWDQLADQYERQSEGSGETTSSTSSTSTSESTGTVSANAGEVMNYLISKGFNKEAAAGITGVFMAESGLKPGITNKEEDAAYGSTAGRGLGQWSNSRRTQYDNFLNGRQASVQTDLDFFIQDLESRPLVKQALAQATSVEDAVRAMHLGYENGSSGAMATPEQLTQTYSAAWRKLGYGPYSYSNSHNKRYNYAQQAYESV